MPCSPASRSSCFALVPFWAFSLCWWLLGGSQSWGLQATSKPTQLTSCPGPPATVQFSQGIAGARWSPWGPCLLLDTPGRLQELLPFQTYVREWSISILASTKGQPPGQWLLLKFTMMDQLPEGQYPLEGHLPALMFRFFLSQPFSNRPHTLLPLSIAFYGCFNQQKIRIMALPNGRSIKSQLGSCHYGTWNLVQV